MVIHRASIVGLGRLGMPFAVALASRGFDVIGVDVDDARVKALNGGQCPIFEPRLAEKLRANQNRVRGTKDYSLAVSESDVTFIVVPTPSDDSGYFSLKFVLPAVRSIGKALSSKPNHLVVVTCTVMPGSMSTEILPTLESASGLRCGRDFGLCYNPEFIALGNVIDGLLNPDLVLIGESDKRAGDALEGLQDRFCINSPAIARMNFVNAELAKISVNSFVTMKMSFANTLAEICERLPGGNVDAVTNAIGADRRIGGLYLKGATAYAGPCFPRDNVAFAKMSQRIGAQAMLAETTHKVNQHQVERMMKVAEQNGVSKGATIAILGLAYKPNTNVVDESEGLIVAGLLASKGCAVHAHDPAAIENAKKALGSAISYHEMAVDAIALAEYCLLTTPWSDYSELDPKTFKDKVIIDCWRILGAAKPHAKKYIPLGVSIAGSAKN